MVSKKNNLIAYQYSQHIKKNEWYAHTKHIKTFVFTQPSHLVHDVKHQGEGQQQKYKNCSHIFFKIFQNKMHQKENGKCLWVIIYLQEYTSERVTSGNVQKEAKLCPKNGT